MGDVLKLLITGSTGFLGGRLAQYFSKNCSYQILLGSRNPSVNNNKLLNAICVKTNWQSQLELNSICENVETIIHLAGMNAGQCSIASSDELSMDVTATKNLLNAAIHNKVKRIIYLSTAHVYSATLAGEISELTPTTNKHPYAVNHLAKENLVMQAHQHGNIEGIVIRLSNAFGVPQSLKANCWMLLVNDLCRQAVTSKKLVLKSTGQQRRDFVTIIDLCLAIKHLIDLPLRKVGDGLFNLGGQWAPTVLEMTQYIADRYQVLFGSHPEIHYEQTIENISPFNFCFNIKKLLDTGYNPAPKFKVAQEIDSLLSFCKESAKE